MPAPTAPTPHGPSTNGRRHALDKFYTAPAEVARCLALVDPAAYGRIIEPSAGAGAFVVPLRAAGHTVLALDLAPDADGIEVGDWFDFAARSDEPTLVIGNPPYGRQCVLAVRFLNHAFEVVGADTVAFVLPRAFTKSSVADRVHPLARLRTQLVLGRDAFLLDDQPHDVPSVFQVWDRADTPRPVRPRRATSVHFAFVKKDQPHHLGVRRVGGAAGRAFTDTTDAHPGNNHFLALSPGHDPGAFARTVNATDFAAITAATALRSLSQPELVAAVDAALAHDDDPCLRLTETG